MFEDNSKKLRIGPITEDDIRRTTHNMEKRGIFPSGDSMTIKAIKTINMLVKMWMKKQLEITEQEWTELQICHLQKAE